MALDDVVLLNVDTNTLESPYDDLQSLPSDVVRDSCREALRVGTLPDKRVVVTAVTSCPAGLLSEESSEEGFYNHRGRRGPSLPPQPGGAVWQLQERSADRGGQYAP